MKDVDAQIEEADKKPSPKEMAAMSKKLTKEDSEAWINLAEAMKRDLTR